MSKLKTKVVDGLPLNYESTDPKDFVEVLNKIADAMGGVSNMGVFADITSVTQSNEMIADVEDKYVVVSTKRYEKPHRDLMVTTNVFEPYQFELDTLVGKNGSNIPSNLASFLKQSEKSNPSTSIGSDSKSKSFIASSQNEDVMDDDWEDDEEEDDDPLEDETEEQEEEKDESISDAFREVGKDFSSAFKETTGAFKDAFKFK